MQITLNANSSITSVSSQCLVWLLSENQVKTAEKSVDPTLANTLGKLFKRGDFSGKSGDQLLLPSIEGIQSERLLLIGTGSGELSPDKFSTLFQTVFKTLNQHKLGSAAMQLSETAVSGQDTPWLLSLLARQAVTSQYQYTTTKAQKSSANLKKIIVLTTNSAANRQAVSEGLATGEGINVARQLGNLPGNYCTPTFVAKEAKALGRKHEKLKVSVLDEKKMAELGMGSLLSVSAGSDQPAKLIVMEYHGGRKNEQPQVLVGKGITFDSGGISIKPGAKMDEMKFDMCGAASVMGTLHAITAMQLPLNVVGIIAAAENLPSGRATKPGDVVTSMAGKTIEVLNTDAEGRLVLCDALTYSRRFKPAAVIDIATLTGACVVALGKHASGLYSNDDSFAQTLLTAGIQATDKAWHMPLWEEYQQQLDSPFADMANVGGPEAGSVTAACFLSRFTEGLKWAHLDIAGTAWLSAGPKGATGRPVALLTRYLQNCVESK